MRKWLWIGGIAVIFGGVGLYLYCHQSTSGVSVKSITLVTKLPKNADDGHGEESEPIEPIIVGNAPPRPIAPVKDEGPMPRVTLKPGMTQPPRPDTEPGQTPRMPYVED